MLLFTCSSTSVKKKLIKLNKFNIIPNIQKIFTHTVYIVYAYTYN